MKISNAGSNQTEVETDNARILISYSTPVAAYVYGRGYIKTSTYYSNTTSRHINAFTNRNPKAETVDQSEIDALLPA
jgi:hypothetical protein